MQPFTLTHLHNTSELDSTSGAKNSRFIAGGTNLIDLMKLQVETPSTLVNLSDWQDETRIVEHDEHFRIGAMVTNTQLANFVSTTPKRLSLFVVYQVFQPFCRPTVFGRAIGVGCWLAPWP